MSWFKRKPEKPLREQLIEARAALINEIAFLESEGNFTLGMAAEDWMSRADLLKETLRGIEGELANIESPDSQAS